jgi:YidC/Oxa1 family membrane protein insertase
MQAFFDLFANILAFFYSLVPNYAIAIVMLTLLVMIVVTPLTLKGTRSMMVMQQLQPEMRKIQTKYKDDRQKLNEELLKFYKEHNINPLGGCLPLLVQAPIFLVLYQVLRGLTRRAPSLGYDGGWSIGQFGLGNGPSSAPGVERVFDPAYVDRSTELYQDLHTSTTMKAFGIDLSQSASQALDSGLLSASPYLTLIAIVAVTGFVQQRQIQGRNPNAAVNPQQQMIMKILPIFLPVISFGLPAGLVLYFVVSNLYRIGQQAFISRSIYGISRADKKTKKTDEAEKAKGGTKGPDDGDTAPKGAKTTTGKGSGEGRSDRTGRKGASPATGSGKGGSKSRSGGGDQANGGGRPTDKTTGGRGKSRGGASPSGPAKGGAGSDPPAGPPALQPRARKPKKR